MAHMSSASTVREQDRSSAHSVHDIVPSIEAAEAEEPKTLDGDAPARNGGSATPRFRDLGRRKTLRQHERSSKGKALEIFERVVRKQVEQQDLAPGPAEKSPAALEYYNDLTQLQTMLKSQSVETCFDFFMAKVWNKVPSGGTDRLLKQRGAVLMARVMESKMDNWDNEKLPSLATVTQILYDLDSLSYKKWADSVMSLIRNIVTRSTAKTDYPYDAAYDTSMARKGALIQDMVDTLIVVNRRRTSPTAPLRFPKLDEEQLLEYARAGEAMKAIRLAFPHILGKSFDAVRPVAFASFVLLTDPAHSSLEAQEKAKPFLVPMGKILASLTIWKTGLQRIFTGHPDVLAYVLSRWDSVISQLRQTERLKHRVPKTAIRPEGNRHWVSSEKYTMQKVNTALGMRDSDAVEAAWAHFWGPESVPNEDRKSGLQDMAKVFNHFIMAFTAVHRPQRALEVWHSMASIGAQPTIETWTSLLEGCRRSKNSAGIENVWKKLLASGLDVDEAAWSARVVGLINCGEPEAGLRALDEMLHQSKLTLAPINAAVAALIRLNAIPAARKVLDWAAQNNIEPDIVTFNTLLRPLVLQGKTAQIDGLLNMMKKKGVEPDAVTYTVLLEGIIDSSKDADPAEQVKRIDDLFSQMEAAGVEANMHTFGRMLYLLVREPGANSYEAVEAIRRHIHSKGLCMSTQMHTILLNHYFSLDPPNLAAVEDLMDTDRLKWRMFSRRGLDKIFWERVIKGYAAAGETDRAFEIFEQLHNVGSALTLDTLAMLLRRLVGAGKMEEAKRTVDIVKKHRENSSVSPAVGEESVVGGRQRQRGRYWRHGFWAYAVDCGLLSHAEWVQLEMGPFAGVAKQ
jgi:pentatricopeptide repeat protein